MESNTDKFVMRSRRGAAIVHLLLGLCFLILSIPIVVSEGVRSQSFLVGIIFSFLGIAFMYRGISLFLWKCIVEGNNISCQSLFQREVITFSDIKNVTPKYAVRSSNVSGVGSSFAGIDLHSETGKLFHIQGSKVGFREFVARLEEENIPGVEKLPKGIRWR